MRETFLTCDRCGRSMVMDPDPSHDLKLIIGGIHTPKAPDFCTACWASFAWWLQHPERDAEGPRQRLSVTRGHLAVLNLPDWRGDAEIPPPPSHWERDGP